MTFNKVLVTGGAGFIGANYVHYALEQHPDWQIVVLDKLTYAGNLENLEAVKDRIHFIQGDIASPGDAATALEGCDAVLNFAAESHVDRSLIEPGAFVRTNVEGTLVLLEAARKAGVRRFLHVSTDEVYGDLHGSDHHSLETDPFRPRSPYSASKAGAEHLVFAHGISHGMDVVITRGSNTYGPYQYPEKIIPLFITNALEDRPLPLYGDGSAIRDYMHAHDHASGIDTVLHKGQTGEAYNLGAREQVTGLEVAEGVLAALGKPQSLKQFVKDRPGHDYRYSVDPSKAEALGWVREYPFLSKGLLETVEWYGQNQGWWRRVREKKAHQDLMQGWYANR
ncbi:MAG: dTDP-glucose 4,6-dehydratase [Meiothermus sp.]|nr:dTDP-glucose 4,6-dehydratase [Meiothermus sp.]